MESTIKNKCYSRALLFFIILTNIFFSGCGGSERLRQMELELKPGYKYEVYEQKSDNLERQSVTKTMFFHGDSLFSIGIRQYKILTSNENFETIVVRYMGNSWLFMNGEVNIKIDGTLYKFKDDNPTRFTRGGSKYSNVGVTEEIVAHVPKDVIKQMATGKNVGIHFIGEPIYLNEKEKNFILRFYDENMR